MTKREDADRDFLEEAERIEREEIQVADEEAGGRWVFVRNRPPREPSQVYSVRLPATVVEELRVLASARGEAPTRLIREWVLERLDKEIDRLPATRRRGRPGKAAPARSKTSTRRKASSSGTTGSRRTSSGGKRSSRKRSK